MQCLAVPVAAGDGLGAHLTSRELAALKITSQSLPGARLENNE